LFIVLLVVFVKRGGFRNVSFEPGRRYYTRKALWNQLLAGAPRGRWTRTRRSAPENREI